jgi:hypothetical protein
MNVRPGYSQGESFGLRGELTVIDEESQMPEQIHARTPENEFAQGVTLLFILAAISINGCRHRLISGPPIPLPAPNPVLPVLQKQLVRLRLVLMPFS